MNLTMNQKIMIMFLWKCMEDEKVMYLKNMLSTDYGES